METCGNIGAQIDQAARAVRQGCVVAFPTETVYGLGANALDAAAVANLFAMKERPRFDPLIVHVATPDQLDDLAIAVPHLARELITRFWPGPLSLVLEKKSCIPDIVTAGLPSVAIRCPNHAVAQSLIREAGVPIAAPSANKFGRVSPTTAQHVIEQFGDSLIVLDDGPCQIGVESTVISFVEGPDGHPTLLRPGGVTLEHIEAVIGPVELPANRSARPTSPGQLASHYAPVTPLILTADDGPVQDSSRRIGLLSWNRPESEAGFAAVEILSQQGCLREAAVNLFAAMRRLDSLGLDGIVARPVPEVELGRAIMDRLRRAAVRGGDVSSRR